MSSVPIPAESQNVRTWAIGLALLTSVAVGLFFGGDRDEPAVAPAAAVATLMAILWITEAIPLALTALLPVVLFPALGILDGKTVAAQYFNHIIFLFIGGFMVALAMERWNLHRRIALRVLLVFGGHPSGILLGFMVASAFLSMWISNTATTMMMITIAMALIVRIEETLPAREARRLSVSVLLGVAYSASIGGIATLVGTPPNLSFTRIFELQFPDAPPISFATWFAFALPVSVVFLAVTWLLLTLFFLPDRARASLDRHEIRSQYRALGPLSFAEKIVLGHFLALVVLWLFRRDIDLGAFTIPGWSRLLPRPDFATDGSVAIAVAFSLFLIPARTAGGERILDWATTARLPWHIILLFGGGFALAKGFVESGLSTALGERMEGLGSYPPLVIVALICLMMTFTTELTSNLATTEMVLPIVAGLAVAIEVNPLLLMIPATLSASCAFMMPVATPPNAIIFGTERIRVKDMARIGIILNLIGVGLITLAMYTLGGLVWDIDPHALPDWARSK